MATIIKRGPHQYQAQIRRKGFLPQTHTFETKREAEVWVATIELEMHSGNFVDRAEAERTTLWELLDRYLKVVTPGRKGERAERSRLKQLQRHPISLRIVGSLRGVDFTKYVDERLKTVGPKTVQLELAMFSAVFNRAIKDWSIPLINPVKGISKPTLPPGRERRLEGDEEGRLLAAARECRSSSLEVCIVLAIETGMRRGEIANLTWDQVDLGKHGIFLLDTKNGDRRFVPLSENAEAAIRALPRPIHGGRLTSFHDSNGLGAAFRRACQRAGITGLCFHDLRHEAASRLAGVLEAPTLAKVFGWRTIQMVMRYYNPSAQELVAAIRSPALGRTDAASRMPRPKTGQRW